MRDFDVSPEPAGTVEKPRERLNFFVQRHAATRLHYDFRLELDSVLKSWAVPKGPSLDPGERRLAVHVEDHPLEYGTFEGVIPKGSYGAGTVLLWDRGTWEPVGDPVAGYAKGHLKFRLEGEKLRGAWNLVRLDHSEHDTDDHAGKHDNWLLIKERDAAALPHVALAEDIVATRPESVSSASPAGFAHKSLPRVDFQLATLAKVPPRSEGWIYEIKLDGYRVLARVDGGRCQLLSRGEHDWTAKWPRIASALERLPVKSAIVDGEIVVLDRGGVSRFSELVNALGRGDQTKMQYFAFDLLYLDGEDLRAKPLRERKQHLAGVLDGARGPLRYVDHVEGSGAAFFEHVCKHGLEGAVGKKADAVHRPGRGKNWIKLKCLQGQEFLVVGWTDPAGSRSGLGALLLATWEAGEQTSRKLVYAGRVGSGFDEKALQSIRKRLDGLKRDTPPLALPASEKRGGHWVEPALVADVSFAGWTDSGVLRHPTFKGLRDDKPAREVAWESPASSPAVERAPRPPTKVALTHPSRVVDPPSGITKRDVFDYYDAVAERILPEIIRRPLSVVRCPDGTAHACFFQKHVMEGMPAAIHGVPIGDEGKDFIFIEDREGLLSLIQFGVLEIHPWGSRIDRLERPDRLVFDLDPAPEVAWPAVVTGALRIRELLSALKLTSFVRATGGKGLHVVVPLDRRLGWDAVKAFARGIAEAVVHDEPDRYTSVALKDRRSGRIFVDYLRNARGATAVASWSTRSREGIPVCVPLAWEELAEVGRGDAFGMKQALVRAKQADPWAGFGTLGQSIPAAAMKVLGVRTESR